MFKIYVLIHLHYSLNDFYWVS